MLHILTNRSSPYIYRTYRNDIDLLSISYLYIKIADMEIDCDRWDALILIGSGDPINSSKKRARNFSERFNKSDLIFLNDR